MQDSSAASRPLQPASVLARTHEGRRAILDAALPLTPQQWRFLLIVNGETPLGDLAGLSPAVVRGAVIGPLLEDGLVEVLQREPVAGSRPAAWSEGPAAQRVFN